jgi:tetratricopeptide (TPR) repeat protein
MLSIMSSDGDAPVKDIAPPPDELLFDKVLEAGRAMGWQKPIYADRSAGKVVWRVKLDVAGVCDGMFGWNIKRLGNMVAIHDPLFASGCRQDRSRRQLQRLQQFTQVETRCLQEDIKRRWLTLVGPVTIVGTSAALPAGEMNELVQRLFKENRWGSGEGTIDTWPSETPGPAKGGAYAKGKRLLYSGQINKAIATWEDAAHGDAVDVELLSSLGAALYADGQYARAVPYLQRAVARSPADATLRLFSATVLHLAGEQDRAKAEFDAIAKAAPIPGKAQIALDKLSGQYFRDQQGAEEKARSLIGGAREPGAMWMGRFFDIPWAARDPKLHDDGTLVAMLQVLGLKGAGLLSLGKTSFVTGGDQVDVYGDVRLRAISFAKNRYLVILQAWKGSAEEKNWDSLEQRMLGFDFLLDAVRAGGAATDAAAAEALSQKLNAVVATQSGRTAEAAKALAAALASAPNDPQALTSSGVLSASANQMEVALKSFNAALERWPDYAQARSYIAQVYAAQRRFPEALEVMNETIDEQMTHAEAHFGRANAYCRMGRIPEGLSAINAARELVP